MFMEAFSIWERTRRPAPHRRCKYTVSLLMRVWSLPLLARSVAADTLREFVAAMLLTLIDSRVLEIQEGGNLMKANPPPPWPFVAPPQPLTPEYTLCKVVKWTHVDCFWKSSCNCIMETERW